MSLQQLAFLFSSPFQRNARDKRLPEAWWGLDLRPMMMNVAKVPAAMVAVVSRSEDEG
jgi:hypothetical protein